MVANLTQPLRHVLRELVHVGRNAAAKQTHGMIFAWASAHSREVRLWSNSRFAQRLVVDGAAWASQLPAPLGILHGRERDHVSGARFRDAEVKRDVAAHVLRRGNIGADL